MDISQVKRIIEHAVKETKPLWEKWSESWNNIDEVFIRRGYEQIGFGAEKFAEVLKNEGICSIEKIGRILDYKEGPKCLYDRNFSGSLTSPLYEGMKNGEYGEEGKKFYNCVKNFYGRKGGGFWRNLWRMLVCCNYLKNRYKSSFAYFLKKEYMEFKGIPDVQDSEFLSINSDEWNKFKKYLFKKLKQSKNEGYGSGLCGIGENMLDYIIRDIKEAEFAKDSFKLDSSNEHFLKVTGIANRPELQPKLTRENVIKFLKELNLPYVIRDINKGIYAYCSETEKSNFGFCRDRKKCEECGVKDVCEKKF